MKTRGAAPLLIVGVLALTGCGWNLPKIRVGDSTVTGPKDAGSPATLSTATQKGSIRIPANSKIIRREVAAQPAVPATKDRPAIPAKPAVVETEVVPSADTEWNESHDAVAANSGTVDTSVRTHEIDVAERRWLLWAAIGCGVAGIVLKSMLPAWPGLSNGLLIAAPCAFAAWKFADVPAWIWMVVLGLVGAMALGYKRASWDANGDGIPDFLQNPKPPTQ